MQATSQNDSAADPGSVMIIDDEPSVRKAIHRLLRSDGYRIYSAGDATAAQQVLDEHVVDVILCDQQMPDVSGTELLKGIAHRFPHQRRIMLSGQYDPGEVAGAIDSGAVHKFTMKPWNDAILLADVREAMRHIAARRQTQNKISQLSVRDVSSGLLAANQFQRCFAITREAVEETGESVVIAVVQPSRSELEGRLTVAECDSWVAEAGKLIRDSGLESFQFMRMGPLECALMMARKDEPAMLEELANAIVSAAHQGAPGSFGVRVGVVAVPRSTSSGEISLMSARRIASGIEPTDTRRFRVGSREQTGLVTEDRRLAIELETAVSDGLLSLQYQPQIALSSGQVVGVEALMRWRSRTCGQVSPARFIPLAERTGLIGQLGAWMVDQVCRQFNEWLPAARDIRIGLNVSPVELLDECFVTEIEKTLSRHRIPTALVEVELTETYALNSDSRIRERLQALSDLGLNMAIDDFGAGTTSLAYLSDLPFNSLKLDRSIVQKITHERGFTIAKKLIEMAEALDMDTVIEGIETVEQVDLARKLDAGRAQGYFFSRPMRPSDFAIWLAEQQCADCG